MTTKTQPGNFTVEDAHGKFVSPQKFMQEKAKAKKAKKKPVKRKSNVR